MVRRAHGEEEAERLLEHGLALVGWDREELSRQPKGQWEKQVLAWWLCEQTAVSRRWVSEQLGMGHVARVTQALRWAARVRKTKLWIFD